MRLYYLDYLAIFLLALIAAPCAASAETRVALVIGNGNYRNTTTLANPRNDATDVAAALKRIGFTTIVGLDLDKAGMDDAEIRFARAAHDTDVAMFYYSGHAIQYAGTNYLLPVDAQIKDAADLRRLAKVDDIVADLQQAKDLPILVLDSCRDNPLADELKRALGERSASVQRGLARLTSSSQGMIVAYSTLAGQTANDGQGRNSPYTAAFLKQIETPQEISTVFRKVAMDVVNMTASKQRPELSVTVFKDFYLGGRADPANAAVSPLITGVPKQREFVEDEIAWRFVKDTTDATLLRQFIAKFPASQWRGEAESHLAALAPSKPDSSTANGTFVPALGLTLAPARSVPGSGARSVVVTKVEQNSPAAERGLKEGDVILEMYGKPMESPADIGEAVKSAQNDNKRSVLVRLRSGDSQRFVALPLKVN